MKTNVQLVIDLSPFTHVHTTDSQYSFVVEINRIYESIARIHNGAQRTAEWWKERVKRKLDSNSVCSIHRSKFTDSCCQCYCHCCILRVTRFLYISLEEHTEIGFCVASCTRFWQIAFEIVTISGEGSISSHFTLESHFCVRIGLLIFALVITSTSFSAAISTSSE